MQKLNEIRKSMIVLGMNTGTSLVYLQEMSLPALYDLMKDYVEVMKDGRKQQRI